MNRFFQRAVHLWERVRREGKVLPMRWRVFGPKIACLTFIDGLIPPGKHFWYIRAVSKYVDKFLRGLVNEYSNCIDESCIRPADEKTPVWCCWWQGEEQMPELVKLCHARLKQVIPVDKAELHLITLDNYTQYVDLPEHILDKFNRGVITMTTMSDVLRFALLERYGGYWLDATVFFTGEIPEEYFSGKFFCQRMVSNTKYAVREACGCNWCGFSMAGPSGSIVFRFMKDAFSIWWEHFDTIIDYVLIDYMLLTGFQSVPAIHKVIDSVPDNNEDIFEMYQVLNQPYSEELYQRLTERNVMHKLTYKMDLRKQTEDGQMTMYGYLVKMVEDNRKFLGECYE